MSTFELVVLTVFAAIAALTTAGAVAAMHAVAAHTRKASKTALKDMLANDYYEAVSVLVDAYNSQDTIVASVRSILGVQHPHFEVVVCNDGSTDATLNVLIEHFSLLEVPKAHDEKLETERLVRVMKSVDHANLTVLDKEHGGPADALNAALNVARRPLVCVAAADEILDPQALIRLSRPFVEDERIVAVASGGDPVARAAWSRLNALTSLAGLSMLRRRLVIQAGGWSTSSDDPNVDLALKLHRNLRPRGRRYRIAFIPEYVCRARRATLSSRLREHIVRSRDHSRALWANRAMALRPRYRMVGLAIAAQLWTRVVSPVAQACVWLYIAVTAATGNLHPAFAGLFAASTIGIQALVTQLGSRTQGVLDNEQHHPEEHQSLAA
jgi:glycosyltransferase involved in cell wall biosynthesis